MSPRLLNHSLPSLFYWDAGPLPSWAMGSQRSLWDALHTGLFKSCIYKSNPSYGHAEKIKRISTKPGRVSQGGKFLPLLSPSISPSVNCPTYAIREVRLRQRTTVSWLIPPHQEPPASKNQTRIFFIEFDPVEASQVPRQIRRGLTLPDHSLCSIERKPCFIS